MTNLGRAFERFNAELFREYYKVIVKINELEFVEHKGKRVRSEYDITYKDSITRYFKNVPGMHKVLHYVHADERISRIPLLERILGLHEEHRVECKFLSDYKHKKIGFNEVAIFSSSLELTDNATSKSEIITNGWFKDRAHVHADRHNIMLTNRDELVWRDYLRTTMKLGHPPLMPYSVFDRKLEERIRSYA